MTKIRAIIKNNTQTINSTEVFGTVHKVLNPIKMIHEDHFDKLEQELEDYINDQTSVNCDALPTTDNRVDIDITEERDHFADSE